METKVPIVPKEGDHVCLLTVVDTAMSLRATVKFLSLIQPSRTRRSDHAVSHTMELRDTARLASSSQFKGRPRYSAAREFPHRGLEKP